MAVYGFLAWGYTLGDTEAFTFRVCPGMFTHGRDIHMSGVSIPSMFRDC